VDQNKIKKLISGEKASFGVILLYLLLRIASVGYSIVVQLRNLMYSAGWLKAHHADAAVISIGNITTGGTGKTPLVIWLCKQVISNYQCAILTRGYKTSKQEPEHLTDEPAIFAESCPEVNVIVNPDRVSGAEEAAIKFGSKVLIMDDGFQHRRLARDLDVVTIDALLPFGYDKILPAGLLREPVSSLSRADAVVITRCDQVAENELSKIEEKLRYRERLRDQMVEPLCFSWLFTGGKGKFVTIEQLKEAGCPKCKKNIFQKKREKKAE